MSIAGRILIIPKGDYDASVTYEMLDLVRHDGTSWLAKKNVAGVEPSEANNEYWYKMLDKLSDISKIKYADNLSYWKTRNPLSTLNKWCKVASVTLTNVWEDYTAIISVTETEVCGGTAIMVWNCATGASANLNTGCALKYIGGTGVLFSNKNVFFLEVVAGDNSVTYNLWCQPQYVNNTYAFSMLSEHSNKGTSCIRYNDAEYTSVAVSGIKFGVSEQEWVGNASTATKALCDSDGYNIAQTYAKKSETNVKYDESTDYLMVFKDNRWVNTIRLGLMNNYLFTNGVNSGQFELYKGTLVSSGTGENAGSGGYNTTSLALNNTMNVTSVQANGFSGASVLSNSIDVTSYSRLVINYSVEVTGSNPSTAYNACVAYLTTTKQSSMTAVKSKVLYVGSVDGASASGIAEIDVSSLRGEYYIGIQLQANSSTIDLSVVDIYLE